MRKEKTTFKRGRGFYLLYASFASVTLICCAASLLASFHFSNQELTRQKNQYDKIVASGESNLEALTADFDHLAELCGQDSYISTLNSAQTLTDQNRTDLWYAFRTLSAVNFAAKGTSAFLYFRSSDTTLGLANQTDDPYRNGEITGFLGLSDSDWDYLKAAKESRSCLMIQNAENKFSRLFLAKEAAPDVVLIVGIAEGVLSETLPNTILPDGSVRILLDQNERQLILPHMVSSLTNQINLSWLSSHPDGSLIHTSFGDYYIYQKAIGSTGMTQIFLIPDTLHAQYRQSKLTYTIFCLLLWLIAGGALSWFFASRYYEPVQKLLANLPVTDSYRAAKSDFSLVAETIDQLEDRTRRQSRQLNEQTEVLGTSLFLRMLHGTLITTEQTQEILVSFGFPPVLRDYMVVLIPVTLRSESSSEIPADIPAFLASLHYTDVIAETFAADSAAAYFVQENDCFVGIVPYDSPDDADLQHILQELSTSFPDSSMLTSNFYLSRVHHAPEELPNAYQEAEAVREFAELYGKSGILSCDRLPAAAFAPDTAANADFMTKTSRLVNCIRAENFAEAKEVLNELFAGQNEEVQAAPGRKKRLAFVSSCVLFALSSLPTDQDAEQTLPVLSVNDRAGMRETDVKQELFSLLDHFEQAKQSRDAGPTDRIDQIIAYLKENYSDSGLSAGSVAEHFGLSLPWLSSLFKQRTGIGFLDYLHHLRIEQAKELIRNSSQTISEIAAAVGYLNANTMTNAFKRYEGVTPGWYRRERGEKHGA